MNRTSFIERIICMQMPCNKLERLAKRSNSEITHIVFADSLVGDSDSQVHVFDSRAVWDSKFEARFDDRDSVVVVLHHYWRMWHSIGTMRVTYADGHVQRVSIKHEVNRVEDFMYALHGVSGIVPHISKEDIMTKYEVVTSRDKKGKIQPRFVEKLAKPDVVHKHLEKCAAAIRGILQGAKIVIIEEYWLCIGYQIVKNDVESEYGGVGIFYKYPYTADGMISLMILLCGMSASHKHGGRGVELTVEMPNGKIMDVDSRFYKAFALE